MDRGTSATAGIFAMLLLIDAIVVLAAVAFAIWVFWRIFTKAGYNGALALLNLVPGLGHLICLIILAFGRWPIEDRLAPSSGPGRAMPPGTSVMPSQ
jgi:hypothetical protein